MLPGKGTGTGNPEQWLQSQLGHSTQQPVSKSLCFLVFIVRWGESWAILLSHIMRKEGIAQTRGTVGVP